MSTPRSTTMPPDTHGNGTTEDPLGLVTMAVRSQSGETVGIEPMAGACRLYRAGHRVHHIQIRFVYERTAAQAVTVTGIDGNVVTLQGEGGIQRFRNHDPGALNAAVIRHGRAAQLRETLLSIPTGEFDCAFNLKPAEEPFDACG